MARRAAGLQSAVYRQSRDRMWGGLRVAVAAGILSLITAPFAVAQTAPAAPKVFPEATLAPAVGEPPASAPAGDTEGPDISAPSAPGSSPASPLSAPSPARHHRAHHTVAMKSATYTGPVESGQAMLRLTKDSWAYASPATSASHVERVHADKFVDVTGSTLHYLRVRLKSGETAYVPMSAVELARPADKVFRLTKDTPVLSAPNRASKKLAEVHSSHDVHVVGTSINYMKIRMKDGVEGYIAMSALE